MTHPWWEAGPLMSLPLVYQHGSVNRWGMGPRFIINGP